VRNVAAYTLFWPSFYAVLLIRATAEKEQQWL